MSEVQKAEIPLQEFEQRKFLGWLRKQRSSEEFPKEYLGIAASLPYTLVLQRLESLYRRFVIQVVSEAIGTGSWQIESFEIGSKRFYCKEDLGTELSEQLIKTFKNEYGISGMVPYGFVSSVLSEITKGTRELLKAIQENRERIENISRHGGRVSSRVVRVACVICREFENLTNLLVEMLCYTLGQGIGELLGNQKDSWFTRIELLRKFPSYADLSTLEHLLIKADLLGTLHQIRIIRNSIAHPADVQIVHIEKLIDLSETLYRQILFDFPALARIVGVQVCASGATQVALYLETDKRKPHPTVVTYEDVLDIGQTIDESCLGKEAIVFPVNLSRSNYKIANEVPIILLRRQEIVRGLYGDSAVDISVVVNYTTAEEVD